MKNALILFTTLILLLSCQSKPDIRKEPLLNKTLEIKPDETFSMKTDDPDWYRSAVIYHVWVKGFNDSNGDGVGDLKGITQKLDYFNDGDDTTTSDLNIDALYLSPIFKAYVQSSNPDVNMHGYDPVDYYKINEKFGTEQDLEELLIEAHKRGIKVIFDWVPNHISYMHPWFKNAARGGEKKDWFVWNKKPSQDWERAWGGGEWTDVWHPVQKGKNYYYGLNNRSLPDLNFYNVEVRTELTNVLVYWLNKGFDGVRIDQVRYLMENGPGKQADTEDTHYYLQYLRQNVISEYDKSGYSKMMVGEVFSGYEQIKGYYGNGSNELHMNFDFSIPGIIAGAVRSGGKSSNAVKTLSDIFKEREKFFPKGYSIGNILCNHDHVSDRPATAQKGNLEKMKLMANLLLLTPGTPFIYYGNELGMTSDKFDDDRKYRTNIDWSVFNNQYNDKTSIFNHYKKLIKWKKENISLQDGKYKNLNTNNKKVFAYSMKKNNEYAIIITNFDDKRSQSYNLTISEEMNSMTWVNLKSDKIVRPDNLKDDLLNPLEYRIYILK